MSVHLPQIWGEHLQSEEGGRRRDKRVPRKGAKKEGKARRKPLIRPCFALQASQGTFPRKREKEIILLLIFPLLPSGEHGQRPSEGSAPSHILPLVRHGRLDYPPWLQNEFKNEPIDSMTVFEVLLSLNVALVPIKL